MLLYDNNPKKDNDHFIEQVSMTLNENMIK